MAMTKCKECSADISTKAEACPKCGAKAPKRTSKLTWFIAGFFGLVIALSIVRGSGDTAVSASAQPAPIASAKQAEDAADLKRYVAATSVADALKKAARDPDSLKFETMGVSADANVVCTTYRARNGFGGMNKDGAIFIGDKGQPATTAAWKKNCAGLRDFMYAVR